MGHARARRLELGQETRAGAGAGEHAGHDAARGGGLLGAAPGAAQAWRRGPSADQVELDEVHAACCGELRLHTICALALSSETSVDASACAAPTHPPHTQHARYPWSGRSKTALLAPATFCAPPAAQP